MKHKAMTYKPCCICDYWVTVADARCPNCGIPDPRSDRTNIVILPPMSLPAWLTRILSRVPMQERPPVRSLRQDEATIQQRLIEIATRENELSRVRPFVKERAAQEADNPQWDKVLSALDSAAAMLTQQRERYHAKLWEIALVRWQNTLEPLVADWKTLTQETVNHRLRLLKAARERGEMYLREWGGVDLSELPEAARCVDRLRENLAYCDKLKEALTRYPTPASPSDGR